MHPVAEMLATFEQRQRVAAPARVDHAQRDFVSNHIIVERYPERQAARVSPRDQPLLSFEHFDVHPGFGLVRIGFDIDGQHRLASKVGRRRAVDPQRRFFHDPPIDRGRGSALAHMPATAKRNDRSVGDVGRQSRDGSIWRDGVCAETRMEPQLVRLAIPLLLVERRGDWKIRLDIVAVDTIMKSGAS